MELPARTIEALNVFSTESHSLFKLLNKCCTKSIGSSLLKAILKKPLKDIDKITERQEFVNDLVQYPAILDKTRKLLKSIPDIKSVLNALCKRSCSLKQLYELYTFVEVVGKLVKDLSTLNDKGSYTNIKINTLSELLAAEKLSKFLALIENALDFDNIPYEFRISCEHDDSGTLDVLNKELYGLREKVDNEKRKIFSTLEAENIKAKFETERKFLQTYGYHFKIPKKFDNTLKQLPSEKYVYLKIVNSGIRWTSFELQRLYEKELEIKNQILEAEKTLITDLNEISHTFLPLFIEAKDIIAEVDVLQSFAHISYYSQEVYCRPSFNTNKVFDVKQARHPIVEILENINFVPNDIHIDTQSRLQVITGINMGGKTTYLRQVGCICILAQIGCNVPAFSASLPIVDAIYTRIGANDNSAQGESTFMCEMKETAEIINSATAESLVLVDEIGRGTSTAEGYGIAYAFAHHLVKEIRCFSLYATHFHELTKLETDEQGVVNKYFDAETGTDEIIMMYKIKKGFCGKSYGVDIAKIVGFPEHVVKRAAEKLESFEKRPEKRMKLIA